MTLKREWFVNGELLKDHTGPSLSPDLLQQGDKVRARIVPVSLRAQGDPFQTPEVVVGNTAPEVQSITFDPYPPRTGEPLVARIAGKDVDGDEITYTYVWRRNKEIVQEGSLDRLETKGFTRGDEILLEVIPHDGNNPGLSQQPEPMMLANGRPMVTSLPPESIDNGRFLYNVVTAKEVKVGVVVG